MDQCSVEQNRARPDHLTPTKVRTSPRGLSLSKLNLKGASETTVKILLQRKHQRGEAGGLTVGAAVPWSLGPLTRLPLPLSVFIQRQDLLPWRHVAPGPGEGPGMHPVHVQRWSPGLQTHHLPRPVPVPVSFEISWEVLQDVSR